MSCRHCRKPVPTGRVFYCSEVCQDKAKLVRDRERQRSLRGTRRPCEACGRQVEQEGAQAEPTLHSAIPALQPRALTVVERRSREFVRARLETLDPDIQAFCFMRGYTLLDAREILAFMAGDTTLAPEETPPDPEPELAMDIYDPLED